MVFIFLQFDRSVDSTAEFKQCWYTTSHVWLRHGGDSRYRVSRPIARYGKLRVAHALGMPATFSPPTTSNETARLRSLHASWHIRDARAVMHVGIANPRLRYKRSWHSRRMRNPQISVSGKTPMANMEDTTRHSLAWAPFLHISHMVILLLRSEHHYDWQLFCLSSFSLVLFDQLAIVMFVNSCYDSVCYHLAMVLFIIYQ